MWYVDHVKKVKPQDLRMSRRQVQARFLPGSFVILSGDLRLGARDKELWMVIAYVQTPPITRIGWYNNGQAWGKKKVVKAKSWEVILMCSSGERGLKTVSWALLSYGAMTLDEYEDWYTTP